jgi:acyl-CoA reductase-like NAD-dependent aldehyde dehydrogenase
LNNSLGETRSPATDGTFATLNPATGEVLARVRIDGAAEIDAAVRRAASAQAGWAATPGAERARVLRRAVALLR